MEVKLITPEYYERFLKISAASYMWSFKPSDEKKEEKKEFSKPCYGAFIGDKLVAEVEVGSFSSNFCGKLLPAIGIGGVASMPEERRNGAVRAIFSEIERLAPENGWALGFLYPFSISYYEKFGYAMATRKAEITVDFDRLGGFGRNCSVTLFEGENKEELYSLYNECAMKYNLMTMRNSMAYFNDKPFESCEYSYFWRYPCGKAGGFFTLSADRPKGLLHVHNLVFKDREALVGIIGFLRNYDGVTDTLHIQGLSVDSPLFSVFSSTDGVKYSVQNGAACRIYDMKAVLEANKYPNGKGCFRLRSVDAMEQNSGVFTVEYENGAARVSKADSGEWDISLTPTAASHLILSGRGYDAETAAYLAGVEINNAAEGFFAAFPKRDTNFVDGF